jgi:hypothetical protein
MLEGPIVLAGRRCPNNSPLQAGILRSENPGNIYKSPQVSRLLTRTSDEEDTQPKRVRPEESREV